MSSLPAKSPSEQALGCALVLGICFAMLLVLLVAGLWLLTALSPDPPLKLAPGVLVWIGFVVAIAFGIWLAKTIQVRRLRSALRANKHLMCLGCRYPLSSLASEGQCPECGLTYTHQGTAAAWQSSWAR